MSVLFLFLYLFKKHQSECLFKVVKCPNAGCAKMLCKRDMKTHQTLKCSWRKVNCDYCEESVIMNQKQVWNKLYIIPLQPGTRWFWMPRYLDLKCNHLPLDTLFQPFDIIPLSQFSHRFCLVTVRIRESLNCRLGTPKTIDIFNRPVHATPVKSENCVSIPLWKHSKCFLPQFNSLLF